MRVWGRVFWTFLAGENDRMRLKTCPKTCIFPYFCHFWVDFCRKLSGFCRFFWRSLGICINFYMEIFVGQWETHFDPLEWCSTGHTLLKKVIFGSKPGLGPGIVASKWAERNFTGISGPKM